MKTTIKFDRMDVRLGRHVEHDSRSLQYAFPTEGLTIVSVVHARNIPILDQGDVGSCTGNAGIGSMGTDPLYEALPTTPTESFTLDENGALKLYSDAEVIDGDGPYPPNDNGSSGLSIAKALKNAGYISGYQHTFTANDALLALSVTPVMFGTNWYNNMFTPDADGRLHITGALAGGHEIEIREYDAVNQRVWIDNSWGASWGVNGRAYLTLADFTTLLGRQGDITVLLPLTQPAPAPTPVPVPPAPTPAPAPAPSGQMKPVFTATANPNYVVLLDGAAQTPTHSSAFEAAEHAGGLKLANPSSEVLVATSGIEKVTLIPV